MVAAPRFKVTLGAGHHKPGDNLLPGAYSNVTVTARLHGKPDTGYLGTIHFSSSDPQAGLPKDYQFQASDNGTQTFTVILNTVGRQSVTVADVTRAQVKGKSNRVKVTPSMALSPRELASATADANLAALAAWAADPSSGATSAQDWFWPVPEGAAKRKI